MHDEIFLDVDLQRLGIDLHDHGVDATGSGASFWTEIAGRFQTRLCPRLDRAAHRIRLACEFTQRNGHARKVLHFHHSIGEFEFIFGRVEMFGGEFENFLAHNFRGFIDRIARNDRAAAGERPRAPIELVGVACDDIDLVYIHANLLRDDLRETREVTLSLRANARDDRDARRAAEPVHQWGQVSTCHIARAERDVLERIRMCQVET